MGKHDSYREMWKVVSAKGYGLGIVTEVIIIAIRINYSDSMSI
jgi:hypothetical protein